MGDLSSKQADNASKTYQNLTLSATERFELAKIAIKALEKYTMKLKVDSNCFTTQSGVMACTCNPATLELVPEWCKFNTSWG